MSKKVGLVTFYKDNYGSILQCYSTKKTMEQWGYTCQVLSEYKTEGKYGPKQKIKRFFLLLSYCIKDPHFFMRWIQTHNLPAPLTRKSKQMMDLFVENYIAPLSYTWKDLRNIGEEWDAFVVGSDQVWNAYNSISPFFFLKFTPQNKRIAFSISFGVEKYSKKFLKVIKSGIAGFSNISVREKAGERILNSISYSKTLRISDPTFMLDSKEWKDFCGEIPVKWNRYILVHFINYPSKLAINYINKVRENRKIICIGYKYNVFDENSWDYVDGGPKEYVAYISQADLVCTDSYHSTIFSINLGVPFYTFERQYLHVHPQTNRIYEILERYHLKDRFISDIKQICTSEVSNTGALIDKDRRSCKEYLIYQLDQVCNHK